MCTRLRFREKQTLSIESSLIVAGMLDISTLNQDFTNVPGAPGSGAGYTTSILYSPLLGK